MKLRIKSSIKGKKPVSESRKRKSLKLKTAAAVALLTLAPSMPLRASDSSPAYNFMNIPSSAKIYGLGGINISLVDDDISVVGQNPALLGQEMSNMLSLGYIRYLGSSNFAFLRYGHSVGSYGTWSAAIDYFGYGSIKETLPDGSATGNTISPSDMSFSAMYSHNITDRLRGGANVKFLYSHYGDYSAMALATDFGINYYNDENDLSLSVVVANLGGQIKRFNESYDRLPFDIRLGWSQSFSGFPVRFSITAWNLTKWKLPYYETGDGSEDSEMKKKDSFGSNLFRHLIFGADLVSSENFFVGLGYNYKTRTDMSTYNRNFLSGFSLAAGFRAKNFQVSGAFAQPHSGASTFMLNISCDINQFFQ